MNSMNWILFAFLITPFSVTMANGLDGNCDSSSVIMGSVGSTAGLLLDVVNTSSNRCPDAPDPSRLDGICDNVMTNDDAPAGSPNLYLYEDKIHQAACVLPNDSAEVIQRKVQHMWSSLEQSRQHSHLLKCRAFSDRSILKYSVARRNWEFLNSAITKWQVNLNTIDAVDNSTLLDFIEDQIVRYRNQPDTLASLTHYKILLIQRGAKLRSEL